MLYPCPKCLYYRAGPPAGPNPCPVNTLGPHNLETLPGLQCASAGSGAGSGAGAGAGPSFEALALAPEAKPDRKPRAPKRARTGGPRPLDRPELLQLFGLDGSWRQEGLGPPTDIPCVPGFDDTDAIATQQAASLLAAVRNMTDTMRAIVGKSLNSGLRDVGTPAGAAAARAAATATATGLFPAPGTRRAEDPYLFSPEAVATALGLRARHAIAATALHTLSPAAAQMYWLTNTVAVLRMIKGAEVQARRNARIRHKLRAANVAVGHTVLTGLGLPCCVAGGATPPPAPTPPP